MQDYTNEINNNDQALKTKQKTKKPIYKKWWFWVLIIIALIITISKIANTEHIDKNATYTWPSSSIASMLPVPESKNGKVSVDSDDSFSIDIYSTKNDQFLSYVDSCKEKGFTVDYYGTDTSFSAENKNGYSLHINFDDKKNIMDISLNAPETTKETTAKASTTKTTTTKPTTKKQNSSTGKVSPKFKKTMDSYEEFFDEYISFMEKYNKSSNPASMMSDYADFMNKYADYMEKLDNINEDDLSTSDYAYYVKVQARIMDKLSKSSLYQ